ncbi:16S rRNA (guanine(527)-N(7))-methyltransferase RsmG [Frigidibacter sp. MR17.24]|uniref:16S rRNA (guanine(527)-N(7))-methyltransferase RsmG n=1 Tax=Frigidibacter sp. MR17.24 TaxID=3127345 RepID=UPI003012DD12
MDDLNVLVDVSRETSDRLARYAALVRKWNPAINLVSKATLDTLEDRHIRDSAQVFGLCPDGAHHWADLGAGGGFPGLVVAILAAELKPDLSVTLVESDMRKAAFLATAARDLGLGTVVIPDRIEKVPPLAADVLSARALAALPALLGFAERHLAADGTALFPKGASHQAELEEARRDWSFDLQIRPSITDPAAAVLQLKGIRRV